MSYVSFYAWVLQHLQLLTSQDSKLEPIWEIFDTAWGTSSAAPGSAAPGEAPLMIEDGSVHDGYDEQPVDESVTTTVPKHEGESGTMEEARSGSMDASAHRESISMPAVPKSEPALEVMDSQPALEVMDSQPALEVMDSQPAVQVMDSQPALEVMDSQPAFEEMDSQPAFEDMYPQPALEATAWEDSQEPSATAPAGEDSKDTQQLEVAMGVSVNSGVDTADVEVEPMEAAPSKPEVPNPTEGPASSMPPPKAPPRGVAERKEFLRARMSELRQGGRVGPQNLNA